VREERARRLREKLDSLSRRIGKIEGNLASRFIREDRES